MISGSIILIAYYADNWLTNCLSALEKAHSHPLHLVLADNYGNNTLDSHALGAFQEERISLDGPLGFAEANNRALVASKWLEPYLIFLNQDTISIPGWIEACIECLEENPNLGAVSPLIRNYDDTDWDPSFLDCLSDKQRLQLDTEELPELLVTEHAPAPALIVRREVLEEVGPFDPIYGSYYEDYDLCARIRSVGYQLGFCSQARIQHFSGSATDTPEKERKRKRQLIRNRGIYQIRHQGNSRIRQAVRLFMGDFPRRLVRGLLGTPSSQPATVVLAAYFDLLLLLPRLLSRRQDQTEFANYLQSIGWNNRFDH